ncbi:metallo-beta-lactamase [Clostridiales bacterium PH28_bin88]|nr:metallo-beta-lactamase [Clostridiales bacterium PH28_bin88]
MKLSFYGAARMVTGSCYILDNGSTKVMIDCGLFQGSKEIKERNYGAFPFNPGEIDYLLLTHAHIDHSGLIPKLCKHGFRGPIIATSATADLCTAMLPDSGHIQEMEVERKNRKYQRAGISLLNPIYTVQDAINSLQQFRPVNYGQEVQLTSEIRVCFRDAGHILGSSMVEVWVKDEEREIKVVFSGDIGNSNQPIINDPSLIEEADFVVMESTYGNRSHGEKEDKLELLSAAIRDTFKKGGNLVIPAFAVERTQDLLYDLNLLIDRQEISPRNIYIDSPLAVTATEIFCRNSAYFDQETQAILNKQGGQCPLYLPGLQFSRTVEESMALNQITGGAIIISASGMCDAGRIKHHLKHNLWRKESTILFVGYQAQGTLGRKLLDGEKKVRIHGEEIAVKAEIRQINGFSAHADQAGLLEWIQGFRVLPRRVFITHGEESGAETLAGLLTQEIGVPTHVPGLLEEVILTGEIAPIAKAKTTHPAVVEEITPLQVEDAYRRVQQMFTAAMEEGMAKKNYQQLWSKLSAIERALRGS